MQCSRMTSASRVAVPAVRCNRVHSAPKARAAPVQASKHAAPLAAMTMLVASQAQAATEVATVAADSRVAILGTLILPVAGWVLFNIGGPALNQLNAMRGGDRLGPSRKQLQSVQKKQQLGAWPGTSKKVSMAPNSQKKRLGKSRVPQKVPGMGPFGGKK